MIVASLSDPLLKKALRHAARPDEDVLFASEDGPLLTGGFPRLSVVGPAEEDGFEVRPVSSAMGEVPELVVAEATIDAWERERKCAAIPEPRLDFTADRLRRAIRQEAMPKSWVDVTLADLGRATGRRLPYGLRGLGRRVMEHPGRYADLFSLAELTGLSRAALKARFRRRGLESPYVYLRWFRLIAVGHVLRNPSITTLQAAHELGFRSSGNLCRIFQDVSGLRTVALREPEGWSRLLVTFAWLLAEECARDGWESLEKLFVLDVA